MEKNITPDDMLNVCSLLIDQALPEDGKILSFIQQANGDPYRVISGKFIVTQEFDPNAPALKNICERFLALPNSTFLNGGATIGHGKG